MSQTSTVNSRDGPMDKASDYEREGRRFESLWCQLLHLPQLHPAPCYTPQAMFF